MLPIAGSGRLPLLLGAACLVAAGFLAARQASRRRALFALAGIAGAVVLLLTPVVVNGRRNDEGIAWAVPKGERVVLAEAGLAVTERNDGRTLTGRELGTGAREWKVDLPDDGRLGSGLIVHRVGKTLLVVGSDGKLRALELATGRERWDAPAGTSTVLPAVAGPDVVATTRCNQGSRCVAEARSVADGSLRWSARLDRSSYWLGSPPVAQSLNGDRSLWPASAVIVRTPPEGERYEVRQLSSGKIVARGVAGDEALGVVGNLFLRQTETGVLTATDVTSGAQVWKRPADGLVVARAPDDSLRWLGMPDGALLPLQELRDTEDLTVLDHLRVIDPRTGRLVDHQLGDLQTGSGRAVPADGPAITAANATTGVPPRVPVVWGWFERKVAADGRLYRTGKLGPRAVAVTATQIAWNPDVHPFAGGERDGAVVYDRRSGKRIVHYAGEDDVYVRSEGERIVIRDDAHEYVVKP